MFERQTLPPLPPSTTLTALTALGDHHAWISGTTDILTSRPSRPVVLRWNGTTWSREHLPELDDAASLIAISAHTTSDVWAVGNTHRAPLVLHYDGTGWTRVDTPATGWLKAVTATTHVHVVGRGPTTLRRTAPSWTADPALTTTRETLTTITAAAPADIWAGGNGWSGSGPTSYQYPILTRWDGTTWTNHPLPPNTTPRGYVTSVAAGSPADVWLGCVTPQGMGVHRWDGDSWTTLPPPPATGRLTLRGVVAGWTWGTRTTPGTFSTRPVYYRWTDGGWTEVVLPEHLAAKSAYDTGLATAPGGSTVWAYFTAADGIHLLRYRTSA
ncbi:hypothetical protein [Umezawaea tangerina]|uniref:Galactose oxidase-like protein n=1 Tax=Umezawaea tangerina TaxID=84725 RepID=A0A2T0SN23_9PSEU|nr:hypothetical protein [Umezawaea tangerina]PRY34817.1 hypothetical protein CLV43_11593 [Umezawaea tangerina]